MQFSHLFQFLKLNIFNAFKWKGKKERENVIVSILTIITFIKQNIHHRQSLFHLHYKINSEECLTYHIE